MNDYSGRDDDRITDKALALAVATATLKNKRLQRELEAEKVKHGNRRTKIEYPDGTVMYADQCIALVANYESTTTEGKRTKGRGPNIGALVLGAFSPAHFVVMLHYFEEIVSKRLTSDYSSADYNIDNIDKEVER